MEVSKNVGLSPGTFLEDCHGFMEEQQAKEPAEGFRLVSSLCSERSRSVQGVFLKSVSLTLFQMSTGVGIPMTSQLKYTLAPVTFQMFLGGVTMEGPTREGTKPNEIFKQPSASAC